MTMLLLDFSPQLHERVVCSISASIKYEVPANIVLAIAEKEGGKPGQWVRNKDGSHDVGPMQFNTKYLRELARYGITSDDVARAGCYPYDLAAWRLRSHIQQDKGDIWTRAANYHSRSRPYNLVYRADLIEKATKWADWLEARFVTHDIRKVAPGPLAPTIDASAQKGPAKSAYAPDEALREPGQARKKATYMPREPVSDVPNRSDR